MILYLSSFTSFVIMILYFIQKKRGCIITSWISGQITDMNEERCAGGMLDKTYACSLNHVVTIRNHDIMSTDHGQNLTSSKSPKVIYKRRRWDSSTCRTDKKMPVPARVPLWDATEVMGRYQRKEKGKEAGDLSGKLCSGKSGPGLETKNPVRKETPEVEGNGHLEGEKHVKVSINATDDVSEEGTTGTTNGCARKGISDDFREEDGKVEVIPVSPNSPVPGHGGKKLLVLDLNGLLVDIRQENGVGKRSDFRVNGKPGNFFISIFFVLIFFSLF